MFMLCVLLGVMEGSLGVADGGGKRGRKCAGFPKALRRQKNGDIVPLPLKLGAHKSILMAELNSINFTAFHISCLEQETQTLGVFTL